MGVNGRRLLGFRLGVGRYLEYLLKHWISSDDLPFDRVTVYSKVAVDGMSFPEGRRVTRKTIGPVLPDLLWESLVLPTCREDFDILFCPSYTAPLGYRRPYVVTHLGSYEAIPGEFKWWRERIESLRYRLAARGARRVITCSQSSKNDIVRFYGIRPDKITVIPLGVDPFFAPVPDEGAKSKVRFEVLGGDFPFILFVGKLSKRRNIPALIEGFSMIRKDASTDLRLLLAGPNHLNLDLQGIARSCGAEGLIHHIPFANHDLLSRLYPAAEVFVYASSYEGFGIPVVEAMASGVPVLTLKNSSLEEIGEGAVLFARDSSADGLGEGMKKLITDQGLRRGLIERGLERVKMYRWEGIAKQTIELMASEAKGIG